MNAYTFEYLVNKFFISLSYSEYTSLLGDQENEKCLSATPPQLSPLTPPDKSVLINGMFFFSCIQNYHRVQKESDIPKLIQRHRETCLPVDLFDSVRIIVQRRHVLEDTLYQLRSGLDVSKHFKVTFVGEPAVDSGGPMHGYLHLLMSSIAKSHLFFHGEETRRVPAYNLVELEKNTFFPYRFNICSFSCPWGTKPQFSGPICCQLYCLWCKSSGSFC